MMSPLPGRLVSTSFTRVPSPSEFRSVLAQLSVVSCCGRGGVVHQATKIRSQGEEAQECGALTGREGRTMGRI